MLVDAFDWRIEGSSHPRDPPFRATTPDRREHSFVMKPIQT